MTGQSAYGPTRRDVLATGLATAMTAAVPLSRAMAQTERAASNPLKRNATITFATAKDGVQIFYKDGGPKTAQPIVSQF
jgi:non-heme chloroperoxidase